MASLGQEIKRERELRAVSLNEISHQTKINIKFLSALEEDRLDLLPGKFFIKGALRAYSKCLGLDENYILNKYYEQTLFEAQQAQEGDFQRSLMKPESKSKLLRIFLLLLVLLAALSLSSYFIFLHPQKTPSKNSLQLASSPLPEQKTMMPPLAQELILKEEEKKLNLEMTFLAETWIQVFADGELKLSSIKYNGEKANVMALKEFILNIGNAGGLTFNVNGKKGRILGSSGEVVKDVRITWDNLEQFLEEEKIESERDFIN